MGHKKVDLLKLSGKQKSLPEALKKKIMASKMKKKKNGS